MLSGRFRVAYFHSGQNLEKEQRLLVLIDQWIRMLLSFKTPFPNLFCSSLIQDNKALAAWLLFTIALGWSLVVGSDFSCCLSFFLGE